MRKHFRNVLQSIALPVAMVFALVILIIPQSAQATTVVLDPTGLGSVTGSTSTTTSGDWVYTDPGLACLACSNPAGGTVILANGPGTPDQTEINEMTGETLFQLYKNENPGDLGGAAAWYNTTYSNNDGDALITHLLGQLAILDAKWLEVKDGNQDPKLYLFDISAWDGLMNISLQNFWPNQGSISHIAIYGTTVIPVPAALPLFGTGLGILGFMGWRRRRKASAAL